MPSSHWRRSPRVRLVRIARNPPEGAQPVFVNPYLNFNGNCEEAFRYYEKALGGTIEAMMPHEGTEAEQHVPAEWRKKIIHARMKVGNALLMGSDAPPDRYSEPKGTSVSLQAKT